MLIGDWLADEKPEEPPPEPRSRDTVVAVVQARQGHGNVRLGDATAQALDACDFDAVIASVPERRGRPLRAVIKPTIHMGTAAEQPPVTYANPLVAETIAARLADAGAEVAIGFNGAAALATAQRVGYTGELTDLGACAEPFHFGGLIGDHVIGRAWRDADMRILVGKARADRQLLYDGVLVGALACIPQRDELQRRFHTAHDVASCANDVLDRLPVAFSAVDAWDCARSAVPPHDGAVPALPIRTVVASTDAMAVDWVLGELMGLDGPELNPVVREALQRRGRTRLDRVGDLTEWEGWPNVRALTAVVTDLRSSVPMAAIRGREMPWIDR